MTWFAIGALTGVLGALGLILSMDRTRGLEPQTLVVGGTGPTAFATIGSAIAEARLGDSVRVEPGVYRELVYLRDGIDLVARVPGTVTILRPMGARPVTPSLILAGERPVRVSGLRFEAPAEVPADLAVRVASPATLELVEIAGTTRQAFALSQGASLSIQGSRVAVTGRLLTAADESQATLLNNVFARTGGTSTPAAASEPAITGPATLRLMLKGNVFHGFGDIIGSMPDARRRELIDGNIVVPPTRSRNGAR